MTRDALEIAARLSRFEALKADLERDLKWGGTSEEQGVIRAGIAGLGLTITAITARINRDGINQGERA